jgi:glycosyltransferase involved in cell wall biosynthesis
MFIHRTSRFRTVPGTVVVVMRIPTGSQSHSTKRIAVVVPAFNEAGHVGRVVQSIPRTIAHDIIVVNDHSTDTTAEESCLNGATYVASCQCHGVGAAIKSGYAQALRRGADIVVVVAGDGQHEPDEIVSLVNPILEGVADYVVGDRLTNCEIGIGIRPFRYVGNRLLSQLTRLIVGFDVKDSQCGFTAAARDTLEKFDLNWVSDSWGVPNDFLFECARLGLKVKYVEVSAMLGYRHSYIRTRTYVPRMIFILARGALRVLKARRTSNDLKSQRRKIIGS